MNVVSFVNMKGGVGKTTLAVNVADALNRRLDKKILLVDLDPQFNATQCLYTGEKYVEIRKSGGDTIADIFLDTSTHSMSAVSGAKEQPAKKLADVKPWKFRDGFDLIAGNLDIYRIDMGQGQGRELRLKRYLKKVVPDEYDYVIIDTPPTPSHFMNSALLASEHYLVPVKPEPLSRVGIDLLRDVINRISENHGHDIECAGVVLTIADRRTKVFKEALSFLDKDKFWKHKRFKGVLPLRTQVARDQGDQSLILDGGQEETMSALMAITNELIERVENG